MPWRSSGRRDDGEAAARGEEGVKKGKADAAAPRDLSSSRVCSVWVFK